MCSVTKFAGRAEKRPHCEKLSWTRQDIVTSRTCILRFGVLRWATQSDLCGNQPVSYGDNVDGVRRPKFDFHTECDGWSTLTFLAYPRS